VRTLRFFLVWVALALALYLVSFRAVSCAMPPAYESAPTR